MLKEAGIEEQFGEKSDDGGPFKFALSEEDQVGNRSVGR